VISSGVSINIWCNFHANKKKPPAERTVGGRFPVLVGKTVQFPDGGLYYFFTL